MDSPYGAYVEFSISAIRSRRRWCAATPTSSVAAELLGHARLETTRLYPRPSAEDRAQAISLLPVDE
jgi:hypothetical protein